MLSKALLLLLTMLPFRCDELPPPTDFFGAVGSTAVAGRGIPSSAPPLAPPLAFVAVVRRDKNSPSRPLPLPSAASAAPALVGVLFVLLLLLSLSPSRKFPEREGALVFAVAFWDCREVARPLAVAVGPETDGADEAKRRLFSSGAPSGPSAATVGSGMIEAICDNFGVLDGCKR